MLAVIVLNWNGGDDTIACLRSVYESDYDGDLVVYVPDNASTDGSPERILREFPQARVIQNGGNLGFSGGNNPGWRRAVADGAEWVFFLNNDAAVAPDCLRRMVEVCRAYPEIGAASPKIYFGTPATHPAGELAHGAEPAIWFEKGSCRLNMVGGIGHIEATADERDMLWYESPLCTGCCFLTTAKLLEETGGFDENFFAYFEDVDLSLKLRSMGLKCAVVPGAYAWHKVSQSTRNEKSPSTWYYIFRNGHYIIQRHADPKSDLATYRRNGLFQTLRQIGTMVEYNSFPAGVSSLQGLVGAWQGQTGIRPARRPGLGLKAATHVIYRSYRLRNRLKRIFARG